MCICETVYRVHRLRKVEMRRGGNAHFVPLGLHFKELWYFIRHQLCFNPHVLWVFWPVTSFTVKHYCIVALLMVTEINKWAVGLTRISTICSLLHKYPEIGIKPGSRCKKRFFFTRVKLCKHRKMLPYSFLQICKAPFIRFTSICNHERMKTLLNFIICVLKHHFHHS